MTSSSSSRPRPFLPSLAAMANIVRITLLSALSLSTLAHSLPLVSYSAPPASALVPVMAQIHTYSAGPSPRVAALSSPSPFWSERQKRGLFSSLAALGELASGASAMANSASSGSSLLSSALNSATGGSKDPDDEGGLLSSSSSSSSSVSKPIPYKFTSAEMTAIQAMVSLRDIIGELLQKVGFNIPAIASFITRSGEGDKAAASSTSNFLSSDSGSLSSTATKSTNVGVQVLRGLALLSPLIIPMATQIRRMSPDYSASSLAPAATLSLPSLQSMSVPMPPMPQMVFPDIYYNQAMHRRRGKRSVGRRAMRTVAAAQHPLLFGYLGRSVR